MKSSEFAGRVIAGLAATLVATSVAWAARPSTTWDGLELTHRKGIDLVYVRPHVQFKAYQAVLIDPVEVAFDRNWDPNAGQRDLSRRFAPADIEKIRGDMATEFRKVFVDELGKAGYRVVEQPAGDTLRVSPALTDVYINAPEKLEPGRITTYTTNAGRMTLVMEMHDGPTGQLLARVVDRKIGTDTRDLQVTNSVTNSAEFRRMMRGWAQRLVQGLDKVNGKGE